MSGNRVEKLESRVEELEASVSGLTEELMQTKARLAELEDESKSEYIEAGVGSVSEKDESGNEGDNPSETDSESTEPPESDDIIVA
ncbi:MAG TPA: bZIP transcription factor [Halococcus sp.]|nr:bZIP transcription factor [Halococcus sp.]